MLNRQWSLSMKEITLIDYSTLDDWTDKFRQHAELSQANFFFFSTCSGKPLDLSLWYPFSVDSSCTTNRPRPVNGSDVWNFLSDIFTTRSSYMTKPSVVSESGVKRRRRMHVLVDHWPSSALVLQCWFGVSLPLMSNWFIQSEHIY